ncbi:MAG: 50S ribosomal protein L3 [Erysipelotrichaceae bacterium]|nr:50S ribosomal protein L3 [Erysipelotrichaceae bacterium]MBQ1534375.1 50S ribosomal protein L3 [Erysipelotrichaceae bacterium]MBQ1788343.1 50S ribosomal protein L3 [Erysipelotrichaceae bacterium]
MKGILGRKLGMTQVFTANGDLIPVTVIEVQPNAVLQKKSVETDGYEALQLGYEDKKEARASKPELGHAKKAGLGPKQFIREIRSDEMNYEVGQEVKADIFSAGDMVDVTGISKGKGYTGTIKRYHAHMINETHGAGPVHRHVGSLATTGRNNGRIEKNTPMPGHDGSLKTTNQNLEVIKVDAEKNYMLVKGNVPGPKRGLVMVKTTSKKVKHVEPKVLLGKEAE